jgi:hypothetical protein
MTANTRLRGSSVLPTQIRSLILIFLLLMRDLRYSRANLPDCGAVQAVWLLPIASTGGIAIVEKWERNLKGCS